MTYAKWKQITEEGYSSDVVSFLLFLSSGEQLDETHPKTKALLTLMWRKELIFDGKITVKGKELLECALSDNLFSPITIPKSNKFEDWWKIYPATDGFTLDGRKFDGSQSKRIKKDVCKKTFNKLINSGVDADDIINATKYHIEQAKRQSLKKGSSQLSYIPNSERYLRESLFEPFIEQSKELETIPEFKSNIL